MVTVPEETAVTKPVDAFTVATRGLELVQLPPASPVLEYVAVEPMQSGEVPVTVPALALGSTVRL